MTVNQKVNILLILLLIVVVSFMYWLLSNPVADDYNFSAYENLKNREYTKSIEDYDKAIELDSTDAELYNMRGIAKSDFLKSWNIYYHKNINTKEILNTFNYSSEIDINFLLKKIINLNP